MNETIRLTPEELHSIRARNEKHAAKLRDRQRPTLQEIAQRMANPPQRVTVTGNPVSPELKGDAAALLARCIHGSVSDSPLLATEGQVTPFDNNDRSTEYEVEMFYSERPHLRWFDLLFGANDELRRPVNEIIEHPTVPTAPEFPAIVATCKPQQPWVMSGGHDLYEAIDSISTEIHCDLSFSCRLLVGKRRYASCTQWFRLTAEKMVAVSISADDFVRQNFETFPVACGNAIVLVRSCNWCIAAFLAQNGINPAQCTVFEPRSDGFGEIPWRDDLPLIAPNGTESEADDDSDEIN